MKRTDWMEGKKAPLYDGEFPYLIKSNLEPFVMSAGSHLMVAYENVQVGQGVMALGANGDIYKHYAQDYQKTTSLVKGRVNTVFPEYIEKHLARKGEDPEERLVRFSKGYNLNE